jgi:hypothetical protein
LQVCGEVQPPQLCVPPQPFDTVPHLPAQAAAIVTGTVSAPQVPMTHAPPSQMSVFAPGAGQVEASQVESPQP